MNFSTLTTHDPLLQSNIRPNQLPIYATSTFTFDSIEEGVGAFTGGNNQHFYSRYANPTVDAVADKIAALEVLGSSMKASAVMTSSGMAAIAAVAMSACTAGQKILTQNNLYGGTTDLFKKVLAPLGIETIFGNLKDLNEVESTLRNNPQIRLIYIETPANPTLDCYDITALSALAHHFQARTVVDNTFATPYLQQPLRLGADLVIHSTTKFLNGHGVSTAGAVVGTDAGFMRNGVWQTMKLAGMNCSPFEAWLVNNGMKTLELRMDRHCANAQTVAEFLSIHPAVDRVNFTGLESHPDFELAARQMRKPCPMLSFELKGGLEAGKKMMNRVKLCILAPSLGETESMILHPASMSHVSIPKEIREAAGITDGLIRLSVGIENIEDILADLGQALDF